MKSKSIADQRCQRLSNEVSRSRASPTVLGSCFSRSNGAVAREFEAVFYTNHCPLFLLLVTLPIDRERERAPSTSCRSHLLFRSARPQSVCVGCFDVPLAASVPRPLPRAHPPVRPSLGAPPSQSRNDGNNNYENEAAHPNPHPA